MIIFSTQLVETLLGKMKMNNSNIKSANVQYTFYVLAPNIAILDPPIYCSKLTKTR